MPNSLMSLLPFLIILLLFVPLFLNGRKQRRQMQQTQTMQQALDTGDVVITTSGLRGRIVDASYEDTIDLEIADGVVTTWLRAAVREKVNPYGGEADGDATPETSTGTTTTGTTTTDTTVDLAKPASDKPTIH